MLKEIKSNYVVLIFFLILIFYFFIKTFFWNFGHNQGVPGLFIHGDGYYNTAKCFVSNTCYLNLESFRIMQFLYPMYLTPIFYFNLNESIYIFFLHHFLTSLTLIFIFFSSKLLHSSNLGLLSSLIYASQLQISYWFNFTLADIAFHTHLSLFMFFFILFFKYNYKIYFFLTLISSLLLYFVRPEGILVFIFFLIYYIFSYLILFFNKKFFYLIFISIIIFFCILFILAFNNNAFKNKIMSNTHVGWGLYYGSQETKNSANEVNNMLNEMFNTCNQKSLNDPKGKNEWWWCSKLGLDRIKSDPIKYLYLVSKRVPSVLYPGFYREGVSLKYLIISSFFMTYIILGIFFLFIFKNKNNKISFGLILSVIPIYFLVIFYMDEWDVRYQLSPQVILITVSSMGFINLLKKIKSN